MEVFKLYDPLHMVNIGALMPLRDGRGAKWNFGRLLAICGSKQMPGAALMACGSALRSGVGLVELASVESVTDALSTSSILSTVIFFSGKESVSRLKKGCTAL